MFAQKVANIVGVPLEKVLEMRDIGIIDNRKCRDILVRKDYVTLRRRKMYTRNQIINRLSKLYNISENTILYVIRNKPGYVYYCKRCGAKITQAKFINNSGLCDKCFPDSID